ncbi:hypothetical protein UYO_0805 [Lachnospiraceae bacterium JC7]|nr:hypothetical protein UYO_0805 [Lachnospiraceae bacterium JC7]
MTLSGITPSDLTQKKKAQDILLRILKPLIPFYSESGARLRIGDTRTHYELSSQEMEAFARPLWGLVPLVAGLSANEKKWIKEAIAASGKTTLIIEDHLSITAELIRIYQDGITAGTDPGSPDYWGLCHDFDQKFCEMPAIGFAMLYAPEFFFDNLSDPAKKNLSDWLNECNRHDLCACNWQFFQIITNLALKVRGLPYSKENMENGLRMIDDYYAEGGWYNDGNGGDKDYYNPFVMLSFGLIYRDFMKDEDPERSRRFLERALEFGKDYAHFFDDNGSCFPYGRSMTYRFAQSAFWSTCLMTGVYPIPESRILKLISTNLSRWLSCPIFDNAGILTIGYGYGNLQMSESYNAPGSPYWALQAFFYLTLPYDDKLWEITDRISPDPGSTETIHLQNEQAEVSECIFLSHVPMLLQRSVQNGHCDQVTALVPGKTSHEGHSHNIEKYSKFAYSSKFGFSIARSNASLEENAPDSTLAFVIDGFVYTKNRTEEGYMIDEDHIEMHWSPVRGIDVITILRPTEQGHIREHTVNVSEALYKDVEIKAYDCGFAIPEQPAFAKTDSESHASDSIPDSVSDFTCTVHSLAGDGRDEVLIPEPNTNLIYPKTRIPMSVYRIKPGINRLKTEFLYI